MLAEPNTADRIRAPRDRTPTSTLLPPDIAELEEHDSGQHRKQEERDGRALAEVAAGQPGLVRERGEQVRGIDRAAPGEDLHDIEVREGEDRREQQDRKSTRLNSSHGYISYAV